MAKEYYLGCIGCVDFNDYSKFCDYLGNNGHVRPCPFGPNGCRMKSRRPRRKHDIEKKTWDTERARKLLNEGMTRAEVAKELDISVNTLSSWIFQEESKCKRVDDQLT